MSLPSGWNNLTLVKSGDEYTFYLNGTSISSQTSTVSFSDPTADRIFGAAEPEFPIIQGYLQDVAIALNSAQVHTLASVAAPDRACVPS